MRLRLLALVGVLPLLLLGTTADARDISFGAQASFADDADFGVGARAIWDLADKKQGLQAIGSFDYFFPGSNINYWEINGNLAYTFSGKLAPYAGAGLNVAHGSVSVSTVVGDLGGSDTEIGLNLLGGIKFGSGDKKFFAEGKFEINGGEQFVVCAGILF